MRGPRKFCQRDSNSDNVFFFFFFRFFFLCFFVGFFFSENEGERVFIPVKVGPHRPASETPFN